MGKNRISAERIYNELRRSWAITKKDIRIYYLKAPVLVGGLMFPLFMFFSFASGKNVPPVSLIPMLVAITTFTSSSSVGATVVPWERRTKTFERFLSAPISLLAILFGKTLSGFIFGSTISLIPLVIGLVGFGLQIVDLLILLISIGLSSLCFAALGIVFASIPSENIGSIMMPFNLVRLPLFFMSGVFIPIQNMPEWGRIIAMFSPLTYSNDLISYALKGQTYYGLAWDIAAVFIYVVLFLTVGVKLHERNGRRE